MTILKSFFLCQVDKKCILTNLKLISRSYRIQSICVLSGCYPAGDYMVKVNNRNTRTRCEICSKLTIKTPEWRQWCQQRRSGVFIVNFEHIAYFERVSIVNFEQVNGGWVDEWNICMKKVKSDHLKYIRAIFFIAQCYQQKHCIGVNIALLCVFLTLNKMYLSNP